MGRMPPFLSCKATRWLASISDVRKVLIQFPSPRHRLWGACSRVIFWGVTVLENPSPQMHTCTTTIYLDTDSSSLHSFAHGGHQQVSCQSVGLQSSFHWPHPYLVSTSKRLRFTKCYWSLMPRRVLVGLHPIACNQ